MLFSRQDIGRTVPILCKWIAQMIDANIYQLSYQVENIYQQKTDYLL
jgi:hypothetical protein